MPKLFVKYKNSNGVDTQELVASFEKTPTKENISSAISEQISIFFKKNIIIKVENFFFTLNKDEKPDNALNANTILKELKKEDIDDIESEITLSSSSESLHDLNYTSTGVPITEEIPGATNILTQNFAASKEKSEVVYTQNSSFRGNYNSPTSHSEKSTNNRTNLYFFSTNIKSVNSHLSNKQDRLDNTECFSNLLNFMTEHPVLTALAALVIVAGVTAALIGFGVIPAGSGYIAFLTSVVGSDAPTASKVVAGLGVGLTILTAGAFMLYGARNNKAAKDDLSHIQEQATLQSV